MSQVRSRNREVSAIAALEQAKIWAGMGKGRSVWIARMRDGSERPLARSLMGGKEYVFDPVLRDLFQRGRYPAEILSWHPLGREWQASVDAGSPVEVIRAHVPPWGGFGAPRQNGEEKKRYAHTGADIYAPEGANLLAVEGGRVTAVVLDHERAGNFLELQISGAKRTFYARYLHCLDIFAGRGEEIAKGGVIASVGMSGNANQARPWVTRGNEKLARSHVHFEIREGNPKGTAFDPIALLVEGKIGILVDASRMVGQPLA